MSKYEPTLKSATVSSLLIAKAAQYSLNLFQSNVDSYAIQVLCNYRKIQIVTTKLTRACLRLLHVFRQSVSLAQPPNT
jgi:hypothetical protein